MNIEPSQFSVMRQIAARIGGNGTGTRPASLRPLGRSLARHRSRDHPGAPQTRRIKKSQRRKGQRMKSDLKKVKLLTRDLRDGKQFTVKVTPAPQTKFEIGYTGVLPDTHPNVAALLPPTMEHGI